MKKSIISLFTFGFLVLFSYSVEAQTSEKKRSKIATDEFAVVGNCGGCEKRIESAALLKGVKSANWDKDAQRIKVIYKTKKVSLKEIKESIAAVGHDTDDVKASNTIYNALPECCQYRSGVKKH